MLHEICDGGHPKLMEADLLILWVHYHDILAKFTSKHWNTQSAEKSSIYKVQGMASSLASVADDQVSLEMSLVLSCADRDDRSWAYLDAHWK